VFVCSSGSKVAMGLLVRFVGRTFSMRRYWVDGECGLNKDLLTVGGETI